MRKTNYIIITLMVVLAGLLITGCDYKGDINENQKPMIQLYNNPSDGDTVGSAPIMYWQAFDTDGKVYIYEYIDLPHEQAGQGIEADEFEEYFTNQQDLADVDSLITIDGMKITWTRVESSSTSDTVFLQILDPDSVTKHLFCVRGLDNEGLYSDVVCMTLYRSNTPPDSCVIVTDPFEGEEYWILKDTTYSWKGIEVSWSADDPDNSIILEYKWWVETMSGEMVITSLLDDTLGGVNSGYDTSDAWVRNTTTHIMGEIPENGDYKFFVQVRDDAFYPGAIDSAVITLAQPYFDISDEDIRQQYIDGTFPHRVLIIDQNDAVVYPDPAIIRDWYDGIFDGFQTLGMIDNYSIHRPPNSDTWDVPRTTLADYSIIWIIDQDFVTIGYKIGTEYLEESMLYIQVGGRLVFDGRYMFANELESWNEIPSYDYFGIDNEIIGVNSQIFQSAIANEGISGYPTLEIDPGKTFDGSASINKVSRIGMRPPSYGGSPYTERLYSFGITADATPAESTDFNGVPVALRYVAPSFRSAYFGFPLYLMNNDEGQVEQVMENTLEFIKTQLEVVEDTVTIPL